MQVTRWIPLTASACVLLASCTSGSGHEARDVTSEVASDAATRPTALVLRDWAGPVVAEEHAFGIGANAAARCPRLASAGGARSGRRR